MSVIGSAYFETYLRRLAGARNQEPHPHIAEAWPIWAERTCSHFRTEPTDGSRSYGVNFPRNWDELEDFYKWYQELPFEEYTNSKDCQKGREIAQAFIDPFSTLWFPRYFTWFGRQMLLTVLPGKVRKQQQLGDPWPVATGVIKLGFKLLFNLTNLMPDPVAPSLLDEYRKIKGWQWQRKDITVEWERIQRGHILEITVFAILGACAVLLLRH